MILIDPLSQGVESPADRECGGLAGSQVEAIRDGLREIMRQIADGNHVNAAARVGQLFVKVDVAGRMSKAAADMETEVAELNNPKRVFRHADGDLYEFHSEGKFKDLAGDWLYTVNYFPADRDVSRPLMLYTTTRERWRDRFTEVTPAPA